jgi:hypothetical protein
MRQLRLGLVLASLAVAVFLVAPAAFAAADPIEGTWSISGGAVRVTATGASTFVGVVTAPTTLAVCVHQTGQAMWDIHGGNGSYAGTHVGFTSDCQPDPGQVSSWTVAEESGMYTMRFCATVESTTNCYRLERLKPPPAPDDEENARGTGIGFSVSMRAEASKGSSRLFPSYIQSRSSGRGSADISGDDATRLSFADGSFRLSHEYLLFADERVTLKVVGGSLHGRWSKGRSIMLQVRVSATNFSGCRVGTTGSAILKDGRGRSADSFAVGICGIALLYVNSPRNQDFVKVRIWTASGDAGSGSSQPPPSGAPF